MWCGGIRLGCCRRPVTTAVATREREREREETMGGGQSKKAEEQSLRLLQCSIDGDLREVKHIIETYLEHQMKGNESGNDNDNDGHISDNGSGGDRVSHVKAFVNTSDPQGNTALHGAVFSGHMDVVRYLIEECHSDIDQQNGLGCSPTWLAAGYDRCEVLQYLLKRHPDPKSALLSTVAANKTGDTPLVAAASKGNVAACQLLKQMASELDVPWGQMVLRRNKGNDNALNVAIAGGHNQDELLDPFLAELSGADLDEPNTKGLSPFLIASERDDVKLAKKLLSKGASWNVQDSNGSSPLSIAAFCGNPHIIKEVLLQKEELRDRQNRNGCTALWLAVRAGRPEVVDALLEGGCDPSISNKDGLSPLDAAKKYKRDAIARLLEDHIASNPTE
uniref:Uncharacterized protein n=1 Tax=Craspedostauros australis TaxID=1486917 RepID=A0A7R9ZJE4_9STRA